MIPVVPVTLVTLEGRHARLEPLSLDHLEPLVAAASGPRGTFHLTHVPHGPDEVRAYITAALRDHARGFALPFATVSLALGRVVGSTRFAELDRWTWPLGHPVHLGRRPEDTPDVAEIGWTWLAEAAQRTPVNTEAKRLMLAHAFETWRVHRVTLKTDARNARSRAAIERLGAQLEGVRRAHMPAYDGAVRDTAMYSILAAEWPSVRDKLDAFLASEKRSGGRVQG